MLSLHDTIQAWVLMTSALAVFCVARTDKWHRWGFIFGLMSEPGWLYAAYESGQWGTMILTIWWSYSWGSGAWRRFGKNDSPKSVH